MFDSVLRPDFSQSRLGTGVIVALATHAVVAGPVPPVAPFSADRTRRGRCSTDQISGPDPESTQQAIDHEVEGTMLVKCIVTACGYIEHSRVLKSIQFMDRAVVDALERRRYKPYIWNGRPIEIDYRFKIKLSLPH